MELQGQRRTYHTLAVLRGPNDITTHPRIIDPASDITEEMFLRLSSASEYEWWDEKMTCQDWA